MMFLSELLIFRGKKAKFRGIFRGKFTEKSVDFVGKKSKFAEKSADFAGEKSKFADKSANFMDCIGKNQNFEGKLDQFHGKFWGETSPRNNQ